MAWTRQHEQHTISDFFGLHQAAVGQCLIHLFLGPVIQQSCDNRPWEDCANAHPVRCNLTTNGMGEGLNGVFGRGVDRLPDHGNNARDGTGHDDVTAFLRHHMWQHRMNCSEGRIDVQVQHAVPFIGVAFH